jgi:hypothetical protein
MSTSWALGFGTATVSTEKTLGSPKRRMMAARIVAGIVERTATERPRERREVLVDVMLDRRRRFRSERGGADLT